MRLAAVALAAVLALSVAGPAAGADADADAAREFSYAAYRLRVAVKAQGAEMARRQAELSECSDVAEEAPQRARNDAMTRFYFAKDFLVLLDTTQAPLATFVAELDRVPVRDAVLRRARIAWRRNVADLATIAPVPANVCEQFRRWRAAGYTRDTRPAVDVAGVKRITRDEKAATRRERRLVAAVRRMRALGVGRSAAERFTGETLFENIPELEIEVIE